MSTDAVTIALDLVEPELDFAAFVSRVAREHGARFAAVARGEGLSAADALDAVQEGFVTFLERQEWRSISREAPDAARLLTTVVRNAARNRRRKNARETGMEPDWDAMVDTEWRALDEVLVEAEEHVRLTGCVATLKQVQRAVVTLRFFEGASGRETAAALSMSEGNVAVTLHRARKELEDCLSASREVFGRHP